MSDDDLKSAWKAQPTPVCDLTLPDLHRQAGKFQRWVRVRNFLEYMAGGVVLAGFGYYIAIFSGLLIRTGSVLIMAATVFVLYQLHRRGSSRTPSRQNFGQASLDFHRAELTRQRDALRDVWLWYIAPFVPGVAVFRWGVDTELAYSPVFAHGATANAVIATVFVVIVLVNRWSAWRLQQRLNKLDDFAISAGALPSDNHQPQ